MYDDGDPGTGGVSTECTPAYPRNVVCSRITSWVYGVDSDDGSTVPPSDIGREISSMCGRNESKMVDLAEDAREHRRR